MPLHIPEHPETRLAWALLAMLLGFVCGGLGGSFRITPGGPFISASGDILPVILALVTLCLALPCLRVKSMPLRLGALVLCLLAPVVIYYGVVDAYLYWHRPHSRGTFLSW